MIGIYVSFRTYVDLFVLNHDHFLIDFKTGVCEEDEVESGGTGVHDQIQSEEERRETVQRGQGHTASSI